MASGVPFPSFATQLTAIVYSLADSDLSCEGPDCLKALAERTGPGNIIMAVLGSYLIAWCWSGSFSFCVMVFTN